MNKDLGRPGGLSSQATEPVPVSALRASIPDAVQFEALLAALGAFPPDALKVFEVLSDGEYVQPAFYVAEEAGVPARRVLEVHRALRTLGFANFGTLTREDDDAKVGSGYWITRAGDTFRDGLLAAQAIEARRAETAQTGSVEDESAVPKGCAQGDQP